MYKAWCRYIFFAITLLFTSSIYAWDKGIYLTQYTLENPAKLDYFLREAKAVGLNTFVIDHDYYSSRFAPAVAKAKEAGFKIVARIVVFADGGNAQQVRSQAHWEEKLKLANDAIKAGVDVIQLDYIRYSAKSPANPRHADDIYKVIKWFKGKINAQNVPMEIDIFGEVSSHPSLHIGQDINKFADVVDGVNPMVYPSHYWPHEKYSAQPYKTINNSLNSLADKFNGKPPFKVHAFIEAANYHYLKKTNDVQKQKYLLQEIRAVEDAKHASGWYVWSANNVYENLFKVLRNNKTKSFDNKDKEVIVNESVVATNASSSGTDANKAPKDAVKTVEADANQTSATVEAPDKNKTATTSITPSSDSKPDHGFNQGLFKFWHMFSNFF